MPELTDDQKYLIKCMKRDASDYIYSFYHAPKQASAALGVYGEEVKETIKNFIQEVLTRVDQYEEQIIQGQTPEINFQDIIP